MHPITVDFYAIPLSILQSAISIFSISPSLAWDSHGDLVEAHGVPTKHWFQRLQALLYLLLCALSSSVRAHHVPIMSRVHFEGTPSLLQSSCGPGRHPRALPRAEPPWLTGPGILVVGLVEPCCVVGYRCYPRLSRLEVSRRKHSVHAFRPVERGRCSSHPMARVKHKLGRGSVQRVRATRPETAP